MPPKEHRQFSDAERQLQSKTVTLGWQKRSFNCRVHQGVSDLSAFLNDFHATVLDSLSRLNERITVIEQRALHLEIALGLDSEN